MANLFERGGLQQDTGLLKQRWAQQGSTLVNIQSNKGNVSATLYTVTAGKTLYINAITIVNDDDDGIGRFKLQDGAGGTNKHIQSMSNIFGDTIQLTFPTPLEFETDIYFDSTVTNTDVNLTIIGWEE